MGNPFDIMSTLQQLSSFSNAAGGAAGPGGLAAHFYATAPTPSTAGTGPDHPLNQMAGLAAASYTHQQQWQAMAANLNQQMVAQASGGQQVLSQTPAGGFMGLSQHQTVPGPSFVTPDYNPAVMHHHQVSYNNVNQQMNVPTPSASCSQQKSVRQSRVAPPLQSHSLMLRPPFPTDDTAPVQVPTQRLTSPTKKNRQELHQQAPMLGSAAAQVSRAKTSCQLASPPFSRNGPSHLPSHSIDALEEALSTLTRDYNLNELADFNENILNVGDDSFFDASAQAAVEPATPASTDPISCTETASAVNTGIHENSYLHSIFEFEPRALVQHNSPEATLAVPATTSADTVSKEDPTADDRVSRSETSPQALATGTSTVTPKLREKIKMKRERELAEIDKAFDRHLSLVAEKNARNTSSLVDINLPSLSSAQAVDQPTTGLVVNVISNNSNAPSPLDDSAASTSKAAFSGSAAAKAKTPPPASPPRFSPVSFSPPVSPPAPSRGSTNPLSALPASLLSPAGGASSEVKLFIPATKSKEEGALKATKVPVYKLQASLDVANTSTEKDSIEKDAPKTSTSISRIVDDAYEFTDEEENVEKKENRQPVGVNEDVKEIELEKEVTEKLLRISSIHPELKVSTGMGSSQPGVPANGESVTPEQARAPSTASSAGSDVWRHVVPKKRHAKGVTSTGVSNETNSGGPSLLAPNRPLLPPTVTDTPTKSEHHRQPATIAEQLAEAQRRRQELKSKSSFASTVILLDDNTTAPPLPKMRIPKTEISDDMSHGPLKIKVKRGEDPSDSLKPKVIIRIPKSIIKNIKQEIVDVPDEQQTPAVPEEQESTKKKKHKKHKKKHKRKHEELENGMPEETREERKRRKKLKKMKRRESQDWENDDGHRPRRRRTKPSLGEHCLGFYSAHFKTKTCMVFFSKMV